MGIWPCCQSSCTEECWEKWQRVKWWIYVFGTRLGSWRKLRLFQGRGKKSLQQPWNMLGEYKTENYNKPLMHLIWACVLYCFILVQKFFHGQDKHWGLLRHLLSLLWHKEQQQKNCLEQLNQVFLSVILLHGVHSETLGLKSSLRLCWVVLMAPFELSPRFSLFPLLQLFFKISRKYVVLACMDATLRFPEILFAFYWTHKACNDAKVLFPNERRPLYSWAYLLLKYQCVSPLHILKDRLLCWQFPNFQHRQGFN